MTARRLGIWALGTLLLLLALWAGWPAPSRQWEPFSAPGVVDVQFPGGTGVNAEVWSSDGRIGAKRLALLIFKDLKEPVSLEVVAPQGGLELLLGAQDGSSGRLVLNDQGLEFSVARSGQPAQRAAVSPGSRVMLAWEQGHYRALVDGAPAGNPIPGPAPSGPANVRLTPGSSIASLECTTSGGDVRRAQGVPAPPGAQRLVWALLAGLLALCCLQAWAPMVFAGAKPGLVGRVAALVAALALVGGLAWSLREHNLARLTTVPDRCEDAPLSVPGERTVSPGRPFALGERRDGDFTLSATVVLRENSALDLLLRAALPKIDREILVTLSSDPALPGGVSRNLGTFLASTPASPDFITLKAGQPFALEVHCHDDRTDVTLDGRPFGSIADLDLRAGRTVFQALSGSARLASVELKPDGQPRALDARLRAWELGAAGIATVVLLFLRLRGGRGSGGLLWCWPLAAAVAPYSRDELLWPLLGLAVVLLLPTPPARHRLLAWVAGGVLVGLTWWAHQERAPEISPLILNQLAAAEFGGAPIDAQYMWARHPLCRRFNGYIKEQTYRGEVVTLDKPEKTLRIVTIGSSSTFGYGVEAPETWSAQTGQLLGNLWPDRDVQVVNAGVPGGTAERLRFFLSGVVLKLQPDAVVIDLSFNDHIMGGTQDERAHFRALSTEGIGPVDALLADWRASRRESGWQAYSAARTAGEPVDEADTQRYSAEPASRFGDSIRDMVAACQAAGAQVLLVKEPTRPGENRPLLAAFHAQLDLIGKESGVPVVGPQPDLDAVGGDLYIDVVHPNGTGHRVIARVVGTALAELLKPQR